MNNLLTYFHDFKFIQIVRLKCLTLLLYAETFDIYTFSNSHFDMLFFLSCRAQFSVFLVRSQRLVRLNKSLQRWRLDLQRPSTDSRKDYLFSTDESSLVHDITFHHKRFV